MDEAQLQDMVMGAAQPLNSEFKLSYYSILNLLKRASGTALHSPTFQLNLSRLCHWHTDAIQRIPQNACNVEPESGRV